VGCARSPNHECNQGSFRSLDQQGFGFCYSHAANMRAAAIFGLSSSERDLEPFRKESEAAWLIGLPRSSGDADAVVVFGGDGTVHRHLAQLARLRLPVLVVPRGSGNDFARALNLRSVNDALAAWRRFVSGKGSVRPIDLGLITSPDASPETRQYFCCIGGIGLDSEVARRANQLPRWIRRHGGYALSLLPALLAFAPPRVKLQSSPAGTSGESASQHEADAMLVAFANTPTYGDGARIAPHALLDDGKLDICVVGKMGKARLLRLFPSVYSGSHLSVAEVKYFQAVRLRVETDRPVDVYADGEYVCRTPVEVSVERAALRVIVP
jgi:diacylglycerol kinase (ATP)